jgi:ATP-binding protein involved in chromosome partitioning
MKIAIPCAEKKLCMHFGHCQEFAIVTVNDESKKIEKTEMKTPPPHEPNVLPRWLAEQNINVVIAGGMGSRAQALFEENGIHVLVGATSDDPEKIVESYLKQELTTGANVCDH